MSSSISTPQPANFKSTSTTTSNRQGKATKVSKEKSRESGGNWDKKKHPIRNIVDERLHLVKGLEYLIDWKGTDPKTGRAWSKSWEPAHHVTPAAIDDWEARKPNRASAIKEKAHNNNLPAAADSQESEPARPPKRKRISYAVDSSSTTQTQSSKPPSPKRPRRAGTAHSARYLPSEEGEVSTIPLNEIADSCKEATQQSHEFAPVARVEIIQRDDFDRTAYVKVQSSQTSLISTESQCTLGTSPSPLLRKTFCDGDGVIPDSQELPGSSSYIASESANSEASSGLRPNTATTPEASASGSITGESCSRSPRREFALLEVVESSLSTQSGQIQSLPASTYSDRFSIVSSSLGGPRLGSQLATPIFTESYETSFPTHKSRSVSNPDISHSSRSPAFRPQSEGLSDVPVPRRRGTWSIEIGRILSQVQPQLSNRSEIPESSVFSFQTQAPHPCDNIIVDDSNLDSCLRKRSISHDLARKETKLIESTLPDNAQTSEPQVQKSAHSSFSGAWQGAQIIQSVDSLTQSSSGGANFEIFQEITGGVNQEQNTGARKKCQTSSETHSPLIQIDPNSQRATIREVPSQPSSACIEPSERLPLDSIATAAEHIIQSIELVDSPLPSRPSPPLSGAPRLPDTYENQYPSRPLSPSPNDMADTGHVSDGPKLSVTDMLKQVRQRSIAAAKAAAEARTKSPSEPLQLPQPPQPPQIQPSALGSSLLSQMLPVREAVIAPSIETSPPTPPPVAQDEPIDQPEDVLHPILDPSEHLVLLPMANFVRDVHTQAIYNRKNSITSFLNGDESSPLIKEMDALISDLKLYADHQDLSVDMTATQVKMSDETQSKWAETCSTKCYFLKELLDAVRSSEIHIAVLARPGRMLDILEVMLKVNGYGYHRPDRSSHPNPGVQSSLKITLLPTGLDGGEFVVNRADAVIAFDTTFFAAERYSKVLRAHLYEPGRLSPLIPLVINHTAEHFELCLAKDMDPALKRIQTIEFITQTRHMAGILSSEFPAPRQAALSVAKYLTGDTAEWPLPVNCDIIGVALSAELNTQSSGSTTQSHDYSYSHVSTPYGAMKRSYDDTIDEESTKRMRMTPIPGETPSTGDVTRVSESVVLQPHKSGVITADATQEDIAANSTLNTAHSSQILVLSSKVTALEIQIREQGRTEAQLRQSIKDLETRLASHTNLINKIHPKYQDALKERATAQSANNAAQAQVLATNQRMEGRIAEITKLKEEKAALLSELTTARALLSTSTIPSIAELAQAQDTIRTLQTDNMRLEKRITNMQRDFDFTRDEYQKASTRAAELATELSALNDESAVLRRQAATNLVAIAEIQRSTANKAQDDRIDELEAQVAEYQNELARKNEELKAKMNGRRETRGTSVPRSPRLGSGAMSPRQYVSVRIGGSGGGSRGTSPAPTADGMGGALNYGGSRDPVLFPPQQRWGHLRGEP